MTSSIASQGGNISASRKITITGKYVFSIGPFSSPEVFSQTLKAGCLELYCQLEVHQVRRRSLYGINWSGLQVLGNLVFVMADPFRTYVQENQAYPAGSVSAPQRRSLNLGNY